MPPLLDLVDVLDDVGFVGVQQIQAVLFPRPVVKHRVEYVYRHSLVDSRRRSATGRVNVVGPALQSVPHLLSVAGSIVDAGHASLVAAHMI